MVVSALVNFANRRESNQWQLAIVALALDYCDRGDSGANLDDFFLTNLSKSNVQKFRRPYKRLNSDNNQAPT